MIDPELLKVLCCPETRQPLSVADAPLLQWLNEEIASGRLLNRAGQPVTRKCDAALVRHDREFLYPVCQNIPILLINEAIPLSDQQGESRLPRGK